MKDAGRQYVETRIGCDRQDGGARGVLRLAKVVFVLLCTETLFSLPFRSVYLLRQSVLQAWIAALCVLAVVGIGFVLRRPILLALGRLLNAPSVGDKAWLVFWLLFGLFLRLAWALRFPVTMQSDNAIYFAVAVKMAQGQSIASVFNPPGLSLFLAPLLMLFGAHPWVALFGALLSFIATYLFTYALASRLQGGLTARIAPMLVAVWPCYFPLAGVNTKETLLAALVPATLYLYLIAFDSASCLDAAPACATTLNSNPRSASIRWACVIAAGLCMGFAALTQPGYLLFPAVFLGFELLRSNRLLRSCGRIAVFTIAMLAAVLPWTYRNYLVFHRVVLISTNGGSVFYRANNALANGQYMPESSAPLPKDEFEADKLGYKMAGDWIEHHPGAFAALMLKKQVVYLGDDALGAFETLKRGLYPSGTLYTLVKAISNLFWLGLWTVLLFGFPLLFRLGNWRLWYGLLFLPLLYQWTIDSVFESGPRHHVPYVAPIAILAGMVLNSALQCASASRKTAL